MSREFPDVLLKGYILGKPEPKRPKSKHKDTHSQVQNVFRTRTATTSSFLVTCESRCFLVGGRGGALVRAYGMLLGTHER